MFPLRLALAIAVCAGCIGVSQSRSAAPAAVGAPGAAATKEPKMCRAGTRVAEDGLIDDLEDGNSQGAQAGGRDGYWWPKHDPNGSTLEPEPFAPSEGGADGSEMAIRAFGNTASGDPTEAWGAGFGVNLLQQKGSLYDGSKYVGITFKARVDDKSTRLVRFGVGDANTHPDAGLCKNCWNHFGKDMTLTPKWKEYTILFVEMRQQDGWGDPRPSKIDPSRLLTLDWSVKGGGAYDVWIDDIAFIECK